MPEPCSIRGATPADYDAIWRILEPVIRAGDTYTLPSDMTKSGAMGYWLSPGHEVYVAELSGETVGTYYLRTNQQGGGSHVANCGYVTALWTTGRGIARAMCTHSMDTAKARGFRAMQFNFVVSSNERAVRLWKSFGFEIVGEIPEAFRHPAKGFVSAYVMYKKLGADALVHD